MRAVMISIKPEWVEKILNGEKTIEIRKTMPKRELPCKVYIYCTNSDKFALYSVGNGFMLYKGNKYQVNGNLCCGTKLNKRVVAEFTLNKVDKIGLADDFRQYGLWLLNDEKVLEDSQIEQFLRDSCLTYEQLTDYIGCGDVENWTFENGYAWHIDNLKIYDKPKELSEFKMYDKTYDNVGAFGWAFDEKEKYHPLTKAPQSWCYVRELGDK